MDGGGRFEIAGLQRNRSVVRRGIIHVSEGARPLWRQLVVDPNGFLDVRFKGRIMETNPDAADTAHPAWAGTVFLLIACGGEVKQSYVRRLTTAAFGQGIPAARNGWGEIEVAQRSVLVLQRTESPVSFACSEEAATVDVGVVR